jgi:hypothetical protein
LICLAYTLDEISDFLMYKFLKSFRAEYKFAISIVEDSIKDFIEVAIDSIVEKSIEEPVNTIIVKTVVINSILENK